MTIRNECCGVRVRYWHSLIAATVGKGCTGRARSTGKITHFDPRLQPILLRVTHYEGERATEKTRPRHRTGDGRRAYRMFLRLDQFPLSGIQSRSGPVLAAGFSSRCALHAMCRSAVSQKCTHRGMCINTVWVLAAIDPAAMSAMARACNW
jgi:hypothetical protein